jgi:hemoglobin
MSADPVTQIYALIGADGIARVTAAFYRAVHSDPILRPLYPEEDLSGAEERLRDFLMFRFGGPPHYIAQRGHPRLRLRHAPFPIDQQARDRWVMLMDQALEQAALPPESITTMRQFFHEVATFLMNRPDAQRTV